jgi:hypothetical protein
MSIAREAGSGKGLREAIICVGFGWLFARFFCCSILYSGLGRRARGAA